jgi:3-oxoacyl-[acyl-carrier-protein] synthase II
LFETIAFKEIFGEHARKLSISSIKGSTGHSLGAAGGFEGIACVKALEAGIVPPTINYETPDPECDLDYTPNQVMHNFIG